MGDDTRYTEGDVVGTTDGRGVVIVVFTDEFVTVSADDEQPAHVVGLERDGSAVYRASALQRTDFETDTWPEPSGTAETEVVNEHVSGFEKFPEGWDYKSVYQYWHSIGGTWEDRVDNMVDKIGRERAEEHCSAIKDEILGTTRGAGHSVEYLLHERLTGPESVVAPGGGRTGDVRDRRVVDEDPRPQDDLEPRTKRAVDEAMSVSLLSKGGRYEVQSASGNRYEVAIIGESCT